jgi:hypothetical protein
LGGLVKGWVCGGVWGCAGVVVVGWVGLGWVTSSVEGEGAIRGLCGSMEQAGVDRVQGAAMTHHICHRPLLTLHPHPAHTLHVYPASIPSLSPAWCPVPHTPLAVACFLVSPPSPFPPLPPYPCPFHHDPLQLFLPYILTASSFHVSTLSPRFGPPSHPQRCLWRAARRCWQAPSGGRCSGRSCPWCLRRTARGAR